MNSNSDNPKVGKDFQRKVLSIAQKTFNMPFDEEKVVPVGNPPKEHKFDVVSADGDIIIECKCYTWTMVEMFQVQKCLLLMKLFFI